MLKPGALILLFLLVLQAPARAQAFPSEDENIPWLITFGSQGLTSWGDDDHCQTFFFSIPKAQAAAFYIRVFDPDCGGLNDEQKGDWNTQCKISVLGGKESFTHPEAKNPNPEGRYDSGNLLSTKTFGVNETTDNQWYSFGPLNPTEGEYVPEFDAYLFKVIVQGTAGDDGNVYRYFLSIASDRNVAVEGANAFTYEYTFRLPNNPGTCHIYPYIDNKVVSVKQYNFDWDSDGSIRIVSVARKGETVKISSEDNWAISQHPISEAEKNTSLDVQFIKDRTVNNNNVVFRITNQYGEYLPFYSVPIGGKPRYRAGIGFTPARP